MIKRNLFLRAWSTIYYAGGLYREDIGEAQSGTPFKFEGSSGHSELERVKSGTMTSQ